MENYNDWAIAGDEEARKITQEYETAVKEGECITKNEVFASLAKTALTTAKFLQEYAQDDEEKEVFDFTIRQLCSIYFAFCEREAVFEKDNISIGVSGRRMLLSLLSECQRLGRTIISSCKEEDYAKIITTLNSIVNSLIIIYLKNTVQG